MSIFDFTEKYTGMKIERWQRLAVVTGLIRRRAFSFTCSYKTAWENWMTEDEKAGFTFEEVSEVL